MLVVASFNQNPANPPPPAPNPEEKTPYMYEIDQYAGQQIRIKPL